MRLPGFLHLEGEPRLVTFDQLHDACFTIPEVLDAMGAIRAIPAVVAERVPTADEVEDARVRVPAHADHRFRSKPIAERVSL